MLNKNEEPIPAKGIALTVAFQKFTSCRFPDLNDLEREAETALRASHEVVVIRAKVGNESEEKVEWRHRQAPPNPVLNRYDAALREAEIDFRKWTAALPAYVLHPKSGERLSVDLNTREWITGRNFLSGFHDDFLSSDDLFLQGPDVQAGGVLQRVFFDRTEFESKLAELEGPSSAPKGASGRHATKRRGRTPIYDWDDAKDFARQEWNKRGPFNNFDTGWKGKADLERLVAQYMLKHDTRAPSSSLLKEHVSKWISEFEAEN